MTDAAIYARISLDRNGDAVSVDRQLADCRDLAAKRGWTVVAEHRDDSKSAWKRDVKRPGWDALIADIQSERVQAVVVWHGDRLVRQPWDLERLILLVEQRGLLVASPGGQRDLGRADDRFIIRVETAAACRESDSTARRVSRVVEERAKAGKRHGMTPWGWRSDDEGDEVRMMVRRLLAGDSLRSIAGDLNERGVPTTRGGAWSVQQVRQIAMRASNAGLRIHKGVVVGEGDWPALVTPDEHEQVVRLLSDPKRKTTRSGQRHLLSGLLRCGKCGGPMRHARVDERRRSIYRCETLHLSITAGPVEEWVTELVHRRLTAPDAAGVTDDGGDGYDELTAKLTALRSRLDGLADDYADGILDREQTQRASDRLRQQIAETTTEVAERERRYAALAHRGVDVHALTVDRQRALITALMVVTVLPATKRGANTHTFDHARLRVDWL